VRAMVRPELALPNPGGDEATPEGGAPGQRDEHASPTGPTHHTRPCQPGLADDRAARPEADRRLARRRQG